MKPKATPSTIKFSHKYDKVLNEKGECITNAKLLQILYISDISKLSQEFIDYDTGNGMYKLPEKGPVILLIFLKPKTGKARNLFTTVRLYEKSKWFYYKKLVGQILNVEFV